MKPILIAVACVSTGLGNAGASVLFGDRLEAAHQQLLEDRRAAFPALSDPFGAPAAARVVIEQPKEGFRAKERWKRGIISTVFWVGESATENNPVPNNKSAWDQNWESSFGGYDDPARRNGFAPEGFSPLQNPFYIALPYNDLGKDGRHRPEASSVIPWYWEAYRGDSVSVCKGRWVAIHRDGKVCFAQWEDVGPFETDHHEYVFGGQPPRPNRNGGAGIDLSPAVRDFLGLSGRDRVEWRFVEDHEVPSGPWRSWAQDALPSR